MADATVNFKWDLGILNRVVSTPIVNRKVTKIVNRAKETCPVGDGPTSGNMRNSIEGVVSGDPVKGEIFVRDPKYIYVAGGTQPHEEWAYNAPDMVFLNKRGITVFTKHVNHPGTRPNPFLMQAVRLIMGDVNE